jgi:hypothetical protein
MEVRIWLGLIGPSARVVYFVDAAKRADIEAVTPPSRRNLTFLADDPHQWRALIEPDRVDRAFAVAGNLLVIGAPTEEVWERFEGILNS